MLASTNTLLVSEGALFQPHSRVIDGRFSGSQVVTVGGTFTKFEVKGTQKLLRKQKSRLDFKRLRRSAWVKGGKVKYL